MGIIYNTSIVRDGLVLHLDAANVKSYPGSGTTWADLSGNGILFNPDQSSPTFISESVKSHFLFDETPVSDNFKSNTSGPDTNIDVKYSRFAWFNPDDISGANFRNIFSNTIGNNADMSITIFEGEFGFHQYTNTKTSGTVNGDYNIKSGYILQSNKWYYCGFTMDRSVSEIKMYVNGDLIKTHTTDLLGNSSSKILLIGGPDSDSYNGDRMFDGKISVIKHYSKILSEAEVKQNFEALRGRYGI